MRSLRFPAYCQGCVWEIHPQMMTTYCLRGCTCDCCGYKGDLALVLAVPKIEEGRESL